MTNWAARRRRELWPEAPRPPRAAESSEEDEHHDEDHVGDDQAQHGVDQQREEAAHQAGEHEVELDVLGGEHGVGAVEHRRGACHRGCSQLPAGCSLDCPPPWNWPSSSSSAAPWSGAGAAARHGRARPALEVAGRSTTRGTLSRLYRSTSSDLLWVRARAGAADVSGYLNDLVGRAYALTYPGKRVRLGGGGALPDDAASPT